LPGPVLNRKVLRYRSFATAPYTYLFIYVPELFNTHIRATAFSISIQAGRIFAGVLAITGGQLISKFSGSYAHAGACVSLVYVIGWIVSFFLPKSSGAVAAEFASPAAALSEKTVPTCRPALTHTPQ
jgi:hypothetical protein